MVNLPSLLEQINKCQTAKQHREEAVCEAKGEIRGVGRIARAERSNPCYYRYACRPSLLGEAYISFEPITHIERSEIWVGLRSNPYH